MKINIPKDKFKPGSSYLASVLKLENQRAGHYANSEGTILTEHEVRKQTTQSADMNCVLLSAFISVTGSIQVEPSTCKVFAMTNEDFLSRNLAVSTK